MSTALSSSTDATRQVWEIPFDGIQKMTPIKGSQGDNQFKIELSSLSMLVWMRFRCDFEEKNPQFGFAITGIHELNFMGPKGCTYANLLDTLKSALELHAERDRHTRGYQYTLIQ